jgi:fibronectin-binding autotransporter adhesin
MNTTKTSLCLKFPLVASFLASFGLSSAQAQQYWDPLLDGNNLLGGTGNWNLSSALWDPTGTDANVDNVVWGNLTTSAAVFGGASGTNVVTMNQGSTLTANSLTFDTNGYSIAAAVVGTDTLTLAGATPTISVTNAGQVARIEAGILGTGGFTKTGAGQLLLGSPVAALSGVSTYTGQLLINQGFVRLARPSAMGAVGAGNETIVASGATLNLGGQAQVVAPSTTVPGEEVRIAGTGVGGIGALINQGANQISALGKLVLTADATVNAGGALISTQNASGGYSLQNNGRFDVRLTGTLTAGQKHLDLAGFTLTKIGTNQFSVVNGDISDGNVIVNQGTFGIETTSIATGAGTITVNPNGRLAFFANTGSVTRSIVVNGGIIGDLFGGGNGTIASPINFTGATNPTFTSNSTGAINFTGAITTTGFTGTAIDKRGSGILALTNAANSFSQPINVWSGTLRGQYTTALPAGGVAPVSGPSGTPLTLVDTPLGTNTNMALNGGTLSLLIPAVNDGTLQRFAIPFSVTADRAANGMTIDRVAANTAQVDKTGVLNSLIIAPSSGTNYYSIGQNQFNFTQGNTHRLELSNTTMNNDLVLNGGDFVFNGNVTSAGKNSLVKIGGSSWGFISDGTTQEFNAVFNVGTTALRIGTMYGTAAVNVNATAGTGTIYNGANNVVTFRASTNLAAGQIVESQSQRVTQSVVQFENFTSVPTNLRAMTGGVLGVGNATAFGNINLATIGDGSWRIGSNFAAAGNGTISGVVTPGAGGTVRLGGGGNVIFNTANSLTGTGTKVEAGSDLINGGFRTNFNNGAQNGVTILQQANDYTGGTTINRAATITAQNINTLGTGAVDLFGTLTLETANGVLNSGGTNTNVVNIYGGSTLNFNNGSTTGTTNIDRWADTTAINLAASTVTFNSRNNNTAATVEAVGAINFSGGSVLNANRQNAVAGNIMTINADSFNRVGTGTLEVVRSGGTGAGFGVGQFVKATGTAPATTALSAGTMIAPYITVNDGTRLINFATYDVTAGITNAVPTNIVNTAAVPTGMTAGNQYVYFDFAAAALTATLADNPDVHALKVGAGAAAASATTIANGAGTSIRIRSGGLIVSGDATSGNFSVGGGTQTTINPALNFNNGTANVEALINIRASTTGIVNGVVTAAGLTKFGAGTLYLTGSNAATQTGGINVNGGVLQLGGTATTNANFSSAGTGVISLNGGQLNVRTFNAVGTSFSTSNNGSYVMPNGLSIAQNVPIATLDVNRSALDVTSAGNFTFNPATAGTGLQLLGSPGVQGQTFNLSGANYGVIFGTNANNSIVGNATINNAVQLQLNNAPTITGTAPVITKSGAGTWIVGAVNGVASTPANTTVVTNAGTLELRSITAFGDGSTTSLVLNAGTLNLRRDTAGTYGSGVGYPVIVNGNSAISFDRASANSGFKESLGALTIKNNAAVALGNGNGVVGEFSSVNLQGTGFVNSGAVNITTQDSGIHLRNVSGGQLVKAGGQFIHLTTTNTYDGGTILNGGYTRLRAAGALGVGSVTLNQGANLDFNATNNLNVGQTVKVYSTSAYPTMISMNTDLAHPTTGIDATNAPSGIVGLSNSAAGVYNTAIDLSTLYGGGWSLGGVPNGAYDPRYTAATLGAGTGNTYRLGGGGTSFFFSIDSTGAPRNNVLTGNNSVRYGFDSASILSAAAGNFQFVVGGTQDYTGSTIINRGEVVRLGSAAAGGFSGLSNTAADVFGALHLGSTATLQDGGTSTNALTLHPGASLVLDNNNAVHGTMTAANVADRIANAQTIGLNGAIIDFVGANTVASTETLGDITYDRGARLRVAANGVGGTATLTVNKLTQGSAAGQLQLFTGAATTLGVGVNKLIVAGTAPATPNGMVHPSITNGTDGMFVTYVAGTGFQNVTYDTTVSAGGAIPAGLPATAKVNIASTGAAALQDDAVIYALSSDRDIAVGGITDTLTLRSGGFISRTNGLTIQPNLVANDGTSNVPLYLTANSAITINGTITANGVVKNGVSNVLINVPNASHTTGWTVNSGDLTFADPGAAGQSVPTNGITINGATVTTGFTTGQITGLNQSRVIFSRNNSTPELVTFSGGPITVVNDGSIQITGGTSDRNLQIPAIIADSTDARVSVGLSLDLPFVRARTIIPSLTLQDNTIARVWDAGTPTDTGKITAASIGSLIASGKTLIKTGNRTLELPNDNSATFVGSNLTVSSGALRVMNDGALGSASSTTRIERGAALEIQKANFVPIATLTQDPGSIERWNQEDARPATYTLPAGVNLQLNTNLLGTHTIGLTGGTIEGFLYVDQVVPADQRDIGTGTTINLLANSYVGQNLFNIGQNYDAGRQPTVAQPFADAYTGSILNIKGVIAGAFDLTKTGLDTVIISGTSNTYNSTIVDMGLLRVGANDALPATKPLVTRLGGTFDLYGFNQTVGELGTTTGSVYANGGVSLGSSGRITNSGTTFNTLNANQSTNTTYNGSIELNVNLAKSGAGTLIIGNGANSYRGSTSVNGGVLQIDTIADGSTTSVSRPSSIGASDKSAGNLNFSNGGTLKYVSAVAGSSDRNFTLGDGGGGLDSSSVLPANTLSMTTTSPIAHTGSLARTFTLTGTNTGNNTVSAPLNDGSGAAIAGLTKDGTGKWRLTAGGSYSGDTNVNNGTLSLTGTASISNSPFITVQAGATFDVTGLGGIFTLAATQTLQGNGTIAGPAILNGILAPGNSPGTLTFTDNLTLNSGAKMSYDLNGGNTSIGGAINDLGTGIINLTLDGTLNVTETVATSFLTAALNSRWTLLQYTGTLTDNGLTIGTTPTLASGNYLEVDTSVTGNVDLVLVPEPSVSVVAAAGSILLLRRRRR